MGKLLDGIKAIAQEHGHNFAGIEDVESWCREQRGKPVSDSPDHIANADKKVQPARCPHCGDKGHTDHDADVPCAVCQPAPLPEEDGEICTRLLSACNGHPHAIIPWPHRLLHDAVAHLSDLTRRLAEVEAERDDAMKSEHDFRNEAQEVYTDRYIQRKRAESAEDRVRELEATIDAMAEAHAHDDMALTAAYLSGAHAGRKHGEAFMASVMEWARGRCCTCRWDCAHPQPGKPSCNACSNGDKGDWTPAWEVGE